MSAKTCGCDPDCKGGPHYCQIHGASATTAAVNNVIHVTYERLAVTRKEYPVATGVLDYFPDAIQEVARTSYVGNEQHHPGQPLQWDRSKSTDEADALMRHFLKRGQLDEDGVRHSAKVAWRALAMLQKEIEAHAKG